MSDSDYSGKRQRPQQANFSDERGLDEEEAALENRRRERLEHKKTKARKSDDVLEDGDPDVLVSAQKRSKKQPKPKQASSLWEDDRYDDGAQPTPKRRERHKPKESWFDDDDDE